MAPFFCSGCFGRAVIWEKPSACNIRAMVSSLTETPNLLSTTQTRSLQRQRTTPSRVRSGPSSTMSFSAAFCFTESLLGRPGEMSLIRPSMPRLLKACTQSRSVCRSIPPMRAATCRLMPSRIAASASRRRAWLASLLAAAACRNSLALIPSLSGIATMPRAPESVGSWVTASQPKILRNPARLIQSDAGSESAFSRTGIIRVNSGTSPRSHRKGLRVSITVEPYLDGKQADRCSLSRAGYPAARRQLTASGCRDNCIHASFKHATRIRIQHQFHFVAGSDIREVILRKGGQHRNARCINESSDCGGWHGHQHGALLHLPVYDVAVAWCRHFTVSQVETRFRELSCNGWNIAFCYLQN